MIWLSIVLLVLIVIGLVLETLRSLLWSLNYLLSSWPVGPMFLLVGMLVILFAMRGSLPWWQLVRWHCLKKLRTYHAGIKPGLPLNCREAAEQSLDSIDCLLDRLKRDVAREKLIQQRQQVACELERGDLVMVVFGRVSSGKTSLIYALLREMVGNVNSIIRTKPVGCSYRIRLRGLSRGLQLIDTPGILGRGENGLQRELQARRLALRADLLLMVVDGHLQTAEREVIRSLSRLGKRLVLVLNKCDLHGEDEKHRLLELLHKHYGSLREVKDIIACSAAPYFTPRSKCQPLQPLPEINSLIKLLATILHDEGEELVANNVLLQCRYLDKIGRKLLTRQRNREAQSCVERYSWISGSVVAAMPLPGTDLLGAAAVNAQMVIEIASIYEVQLTRKRARELVVSVGRTLAGLGLVKSGVSLIGNMLSLNLPTLLLGRAIQAVTAAWLTWVTGSSFITYFEQDQDWGDGGIQEVVQRHYNLNQRHNSLQDFLRIAVRRVVEPLQTKQKYCRFLPAHWLRRAVPLVVEVEEGHVHRELLSSPGKGSLSAPKELP